jgi:hypothetical protein
MTSAVGHAQRTHGIRRVLCTRSIAPRVCAQVISKMSFTAILN